MRSCLHSLSTPGGGGRSGDSSESPAALCGLVLAGLRARAAAAPRRAPALGPHHAAADVEVAGRAAACALAVRGLPGAGARGGGAGLRAGGKAFAPRPATASIQHLGARRCRGRGRRRLPSRELLADEALLVAPGPAPEANAVEILEAEPLCSQEALIHGLGASAAALDLATEDVGADLGHGLHRVARLLAHLTLCGRAGRLIPALVVAAWKVPARPAPIGNLHQHRLPVPDHHAGRRARR